MYEFPLTVHPIHKSNYHHYCQRIIKEKNEKKTHENTHISDKLIEMIILKFVCFCFVF